VNQTTKQLDYMYADMVPSHYPFNCKLLHILFNYSYYI